tara:strand:+ start:1652 stop:1831 length:180 start_codon:yes stop_codon:yes gene_type:complete
MNKSSSLKDLSFQNDNSNGGNHKNHGSNNKLEKVLCTHCGRTTTNGIGCLGICVSDNDY